MLNPELISYVLTHRKKIIHACKHLVHNDIQRAEDCVQKTLLKLLNTDYGLVDNISAFCYQSVCNQCLNENRMHRRYHSADFTGTKDDGVLSVILIDENDYIQDHDFDHRIPLIMEAYQKLPEKQRGAIARRLAGTNPDTNTEKANYRHGLLKLQKMFTTGVDCYEKR